MGSDDIFSLTLSKERDSEEEVKSLEFAIDNVQIYGISGSFDIVQENEPKKRLIQIIRRLATNGDYDSAFKIMQGNFPLDTSNPDILQDFFHIAKVKGDLDSLEKISKRILSVKKGDLKSAQMLCQIYEKKNDWMNLLTYCEYILKRKEDDERAQIWKERAVKELKANLATQKIDDLDDEKYIERGKLYLRLGDIEQAKREFETALSLEPDSLDAKLGLIEVLFSLNKEEGVKILNELLQKEQNSAKVFYKAGWFLASNNQWQEAKGFLEKSVQCFDADESCWSLLGITYYNLKDYNKSLECFEILIKKFPDNIDIDIWQNNVKVLKNLINQQR